MLKSKRRVISNPALLSVPLEFILGLEIATLQATPQRNHNLPDIIAAIQFG